jgi:hypothetical protein
MRERVGRNGAKLERFFSEYFVSAARPAIPDIIFKDYTSACTLSQAFSYETAREPAPRLRVARGQISGWSARQPRSPLRPRAATAKLEFAWLAKPVARAVRG